MFRVLLQAVLKGSTNRPRKVLKSFKNIQLLSLVKNTRSHIIFLFFL